MSTDAVTPAVDTALLAAAATADVGLTGASEIVDVSMLGLDRFDESGRSRLPADPIALPFPEKTSL